jgi:hypothetical protein
MAVHVAPNLTAFVNVGCAIGFGTSQVREFFRGLLARPSGLRPSIATLSQTAYQAMDRMRQPPQVNLESLHWKLSVPNIPHAQATAPSTGQVLRASSASILGCARSETETCILHLLGIRSRSIRDSTQRDGGVPCWLVIHSRWRI